MRIAHLILAHQHPLQLARLVERLSHVHADIYIHIDKRMRIDVFENALPKTVICHFIKKRVRINWSGYSMVQATINAFREIRTRQKDYDFVNLISGADYPLKHKTEIHDFLANKKGYSFMEFERSGSPWWEQAKNRFAKLYFNDFPFKGRYLIEQLINRALRAPTTPPGFEIVGRSQWMTLSYTHMEYILDALQHDKRVITFFRFSWAPDEFFFQTVLFNSPYREEIINDNLRYIDWDDGNPSPKTLTTEDWPALKTSTKLFARKFDSNIDARILDYLDKYTLFKNGD